MTQLNTFTYNGQLYIRLVPGKRMFQSTMVHEVVNRGDIFAMRVSDQQFTVIPGGAFVIHAKHTLSPAVPVQAQAKLDLEN